MLTSSCIRPTANRSAESVVCPYMASALLPPSTAPHPPTEYIGPHCKIATSKGHCVKDRWECPYILMRYVYVHSASILPLRFSLREMTFFIYFIDYILVISSGRKCVTLHVSCHIAKYFSFSYGNGKR